MKEPYVSLATKKKSGDWVWTPVWFAEASGGQSIYIFSAADAGKVKRLKNFEAVQIAPCTISGKITGESKDASGQLVHDDTDVANAYTLLRAKYGWQIKVLDFLAVLRGTSTSVRCSGWISDTQWAWQTPSNQTLKPA